MNIEDVVRGTPYAGYLYSYPHKTAYRALTPKIPLASLWAGENKSALSLYVHVPFCEMRCGFCNLFTAARPKDELVAEFLEKLELQAQAVSAALGSARFARFAIGGGTPTYLEAPALEKIFELSARYFGVHAKEMPTSVETSPETATRDRLRVLAAHEVDRISIGVQSFVESECHAIARPQPQARVHGALDAIRSERFTTLNIDLMYGLPAQTESTFERSLRAALAYQPEELYLYPLYVRPLTGLGRSKKSWDDQRLSLYRFGRELLLGEGYRQISMRMFKKLGAPAKEGPVYCCQSDGMIGLGPGARSYTGSLHYSNAYAVSARAVKEIIVAWNQREDFSHAEHGIALDEEDRLRRFVILSLLADGVEHAATAHLPELRALVEAGLAERSGDGIQLTDRGRERSDAIGPYLCSAKVRKLMAEYDPK